MTTYELSPQPGMPLDGRFANAVVLHRDGKIDEYEDAVGVRLHQLFTDYAKKGLDINECVAWILGSPDDDADLQEGIHLLDQHTVAMCRKLSGDDVVLPLDAPVTYGEVFIQGLWEHRGPQGIHRLQRSMGELAIVGLDAKAPTELTMAEGIWYTLWLFEDTKEQ